MAAPLRLREKWASLFRRRFSPRRKDAKAAKEKRPLLWRHLILKDHKSTSKFKAPLTRRRNRVAIPKELQWPALRQMHYAALQGRNGGLRAVADVETAENDVDVPLDRRLADAQSLADFPIAEALDDQFQHFQFARA